MRKLILIVVLALPGLLKAQQTQSPAPAPQEQYCMILATAKLLSTKVTISIDYGQETKLFSFKDERMKNEEGKIKSFNSVIDALNFMSSEGWQFVNAYVVTVGGQNVYHYVMRRVVAES